MFQTLTLFLVCIDAPVDLANAYELTLQKYHETKNELSLKNHENEQLRKEISVLNIRLGSARLAFTKKMSDYDNLLKDYKQMATKMEVVKALLSEKHVGDLKQYDSVQSIFNDLKGPPNASTPNPFEDRRSEESFLFDIPEDNTVLNDHVNHSQDRDIRNDEMIEQSSSQGSSHNEVQTNVKTLFQNSSLVNTDKTESPLPCLNETNDKKVTFDFPRQDLHFHNLQFKMVFKPNSLCASCGKKISFCSKAVVCLSCRSICHTACQKQLKLLPFPCRRQ